MSGAKKEPTFWDRLRDRAGRGSGGSTIKRTVYGTQDGVAYMCQNGALYRVKRGTK